MVATVLYDLQTNPMTSNEPSKTKVTGYDNTSYANFTKWKREIDGALASHTDKLLTVVQTNKIGSTILLRLRQMYKTLGADMTQPQESEHLKEYMTTAYFIILPTIIDETTRRTIERKFGKDADAHGAYTHIVDLWAMTNSTSTFVIFDKFNDLHTFLMTGATSASLKHMTDFVERALERNAELDGTNLSFSEPMLSATLMNTLAKHDRSYVTSFLARQTDATWMDDFADLWESVKRDLRDTDIIDNTTAESSSTVLATQANAQVAALEKKVAEMTSVILTLQSGNDDKTAKVTKPVCEHCGIRHNPMRGVPDGCIGKAVHDKTMTRDEGLAAFKWAKNPAALLDAAVANVVKKTGAPPSGPVTRPTKSINLMVTATPRDGVDMITNDARISASGPAPQVDTTVSLGLLDLASSDKGVKESMTIKWDTMAEHTILSSSAFFRDGLDTTRLLDLHAIGGATGVTTQGCGTAYMTLLDGTEIAIPDAHLSEHAQFNVVATRSVKHTRVDIDELGMRHAPTGLLIPFDAGYWETYVRCGYGPTNSMVRIDVPTPRHPAATSAILVTGETAAKFFGGVTRGPKSSAGLSELTPSELGALYHFRTDLGAATLRTLHDDTDAPSALAKIPMGAANDHDSLRANMEKQPTQPSSGRIEKVFTFDLNGPHEPSQFSGYRWHLGVTLIFDAEHTAYLPFFLKTKDQVPNAIADLLDMGARKGLNMKDWQGYCDNENVLNSKDVKQLLQRRGMAKLRNSCAYHPWQNGRQERSFRTTGHGNRAFLQRGFGDPDDPTERDSYWPCAVLQRTQVHNAMHSLVDVGVGRVRRVAHLRVPFCLAYVKTPKCYLRGKLAPQAEACMHLYWDDDKFGYALEVLEGERKGKVIFSTQVKFLEHVFPKKNDGWRDRSSGDILWADIDVPETVVDLAEKTIATRTDDTAPTVPATLYVDDGDDEVDMPDLIGAEPVTDDDDETPDDDDETPALRQPATSGRQTRSQGGVGDHTVVFTQLDRGMRDGTIAGILATESKEVPKSFASILKMPDTTERNAWLKSYYAEAEGLFDVEDVLKAIPLPPSVSMDELLHLLIVFTIKRDGRYKTRIVLGAGKNKLGLLDLGFGRTFAPTARVTTFHFLCSLAAAKGLTIRGGDIKQAYKLGKWPETMKKVLAHMPPGYHKYYDGIPYCCEVGNLYGHPVAGRNWWLRLLEFLLADGFTQSEHDPCLFLKHGENGAVLYAIVYVDDLLWFTDSDNMSSQFEASIGETFDWTNYGTDVSDFLSTEITQTETAVTLSMAKYIERMVTETFPGGVHHSYTVPADTDLRDVVYKASQVKDTSEAKTELAKRFRRLCMQLLYCASQCRPDIMAAIGYLTRVQAWPSIDLMQRAERVLIYLWGTKDLKIIYRRSDNLEPKMQWAPRVAVLDGVSIVGSSDSDLAVAHSTSAYIFEINGAPISWAMVKQQSIALNTQQAEIHAGSLAACEAIFILGLAAECGVSQSCMPLYMDSSSAIDLAHDPMMHSKSKHIARRDLFIRELVERGVIKPIYVSTSDNVSDLLTKPLSKGPFIKHRDLLLSVT